jgi:hypothetical protein
MMLSNQEMQEQLKDNTGLFSTSQLIFMLLAVCEETSTSSLALICDNLSTRFQDEGSALLHWPAMTAETSGDDAKQSQEVAATIQAWTKLVDQLLGKASYLQQSDCKYKLLRLALDIVAVLQPADVPLTLLLASRVADIIASDLTQRSFRRGVFRELSVCLGKLSPLIGPSRYAQIVGMLRDHFVADASHDECLDIFLGEADHMSGEVSDLFFHKAIEAFNSQQASGMVSRFLHWWGGAKSNDAKTQNLARLFSHCIRETKIDDLGAAESFPVITGQPALANMMKFLPRLMNLSYLEAEIEMKANLILKYVNQINLLLVEGRLSLQLLLILKDEVQVERLLTLTSSIEDSNFSREDLKTFVRLRLDELEEYNKASEDIRSFVSKFDDIKGSSSVNEILAQFAKESRMVELREVCQLRSKTGPIRLLITHLSSEDLEQVRRHNDLYNSAVFRIIQDRVLLEGGLR